MSECYATQGGSSGFGLTDLMQEYMPVVDSDNLLGSMPLGVAPRRDDVCGDVVQPGGKFDAGSFDRVESIEVGTGFGGFSICAVVDAEVWECVQ